MISLPIDPQGDAISLGSKIVPPQLTLLFILALVI